MRRGVTFGALDLYSERLEKGRGTFWEYAVPRTGNESFLSCDVSLRHLFDLFSGTTQDGSQIVVISCGRKVSVKMYRQTRNNLDSNFYVSKGKQRPRSKDFGERSAF